MRSPGPFPHARSRSATAAAAFPLAAFPLGLLLLGLLLLGSFLSPLSASAQDTDDEIRENALRVFLDCNAPQCDGDYFRTEIAFVNWVRDRTLAQTHLIVTSAQTGGGGREYLLEFLGLEELEGDDDELALTTLGTDTEDEVLTALKSVIAAGLARYSAAIGQPTAFQITPTEVVGQQTDRIVGADEAQDPWNFWVFEVSGDMEFEGEDTERQREFGAFLQASRTTELWKLEIFSGGELSRDEREFEDGERVVDERTNWNADFLLARAIAPSWSLGMMAGAGAATRLNQDFGADAAASLEYSFWPYEEAPRRSLTARYDLRIQHYDWEEETIFGEISETRPQHEIRMELFQRQAWGESRASISASQFLHDLGLWNVALSGDIELRIFRGLNLEVRGELDFIEDQIFVSREGLTDEEILLGRFERPTDSSYEFSVGLSYEFGSIFNNVVNNRFGSRNFGGGGGGDFD